ncbi:type III secretion system stator protein SctL [Ralstonia pseudosolanacearum]|uniref:type III secretion system stator protein SctL n=1 Tax=Ralstonia pseudosolanacearum TaxID=1310165 RepID=UPI0026755C20|nr:type III secretion system stator protein SctL [Ralstonia pseudosolanacearum]MDO3521486.1 type III secretion system stator protein SctL [Ralstonia pseudosolanacearum]MDO3545405.1 type III secretion system stator protein SctL [Ralstonia pseudosolanacearum]MDO3550790.1 type III secretion system stator protein SctL [Ralstonia pseudosolanacearum]MDO3565482.1 type III secretion system stator protein SctL [Ralstonia pseudosolanacearum]MDO3580638.1 type III secretion system stator protein SctL [Ral
MVIWLRREAALGVSSDVIRAADRHRVVELDAAVQAVYEERDAVLAAARAKAEAIVAQARAVADDLIKDANERAANSEQLGYAEGQRKALAEFHASMVARAYSEAESTRRVEARLQTAVMQAVERIVLESDRQALFARVASTLGGVLQSQARLTLRVCPAELDAARAAFARAVEGGLLNATVEVLADDSTKPGDCRCEWDHGVADASLSVQLAALRKAIAPNASVPAEAAQPAAAEDEEEDADIDAPDEYEYDYDDSEDEEDEDAVSHEDDEDEEDDDHDDSDDDEDEDLYEEDDEDEDEEDDE